MKTGPYAPNTSAKAPGANGPAPLPSGSAGPQTGITKTVANPGDPNFGASQNLKGQHPKSRAIPVHSAHVNNTDPERGTVGDGDAMLNGACGANENDFAE